MAGCESLLQHHYVTNDLNYLIKRAQRPASTVSRIVLKVPRKCFTVLSLSSYSFPRNLQALYSLLISTI